MATSTTPSDRVGRYAVAGIGLAVFSLSALHLRLDDDPLATAVIEVAVPVAVGLGLVGVGASLARSDLSTDQHGRVGQWTVAGGLVLSVLGTWSFYLQTMEGVPATDVVSIVLTDAAVGAVLGVAVGLWRVRERDGIRGAERARSALDASMDGMGVVDDQGRFVEVNRAFADLFGYDDPATLHGEHWRVCYPREAVEEMETDVVPALLDAGRWRGELVGQRPDGTTFEHDASFTAMETGEYVLVVRDVTERKRRERRLEALQAGTRRLIEAESDAEVADELVAIVDEIFDGSLATFRTYDPGAEALVPAAVSPAARELVAETDAGSVPPLTEGNEGMAAFHEDESRLFEDYREVEDPPHTGPTVATLLYIPVDDHGLLAIGARDVAAIDPAERYLLETLTDSASAALDRIEREQDIVRRRRRLRTLVENLPLILFALDGEGRITLQEGKALETVDVEPDELIGESVFDVFADVPTITDAVERGLDGESVEVTADAWGRTYRVFYEPIAGSDGVIGVAIDVTEREQAVGQLAESERRLTQLTEHAREVLWLAEADWSELLFVNSAYEDIWGQPRTRLDEDPTAFLEGIHPDDREIARRTMERLSGGESAEFEYRVNPAEDYGRWVWGRGEPILDDDGEVERIAGFVTDVTERRRRERAVAALHDATRRMLGTTDRQAIATIAIDTTETALDIPIGGLWLADEPRERLQPVASSAGADDLFGDLPVYTAGEGVSWRAYETGETLEFEDVSAEADVYDPDTPIRSEVVVPLGEYGVLTCGSTTGDAFDAADVALLELLAANVRVALELAARERRLERQTRQMEFFNSILRHDVLNAMTVMRSRAEILAEDLEGRNADYAATVVDWCDNVTEVVGRVRRVLAALTDERDRDTEPVDLVETVRSEVARVGDTYDDVEFAVDVPDGVMVQADELLADVLANVVTNAVEHNDPADLRVAVGVETDATTATVRVADNGSGVPDEMKEGVFRRGETGHAKATGSGFGLFFVDAMVAEYGGSIHIEDNDPEGAVVVIELPLAAPVAGGSAAE